MTIIEQLNDLCTEYEGGALALSVVTDIRAIIEQEKSKISEGLKNSQAEQEKDKLSTSEPVAYRVIGPYEDSPFRDKSSAEAFCRGLNKGFGDASYLIEPLYTAPQPDHTKLIGELVTALEGVLDTVQLPESTSTPTAARIHALITKAREAVK